MMGWLGPGQGYNFERKATGMWKEENSGGSVSDGE